MCLSSLASTRILWENTTISENNLLTFVISCTNITTDLTRVLSVMQRGQWQGVIAIINQKSYL